MDEKVKFIEPNQYIGIDKDPVLEKDDVVDFFLGNTNSPPLYPLYQPIVEPEEPDPVL